MIPQTVACQAPLAPLSMEFSRQEYWSGLPLPSLHFYLEALKFFFTFCHKGDVISISEVIDISPAILIPACASSSLAFLMMYSAYKLNEQGDSVQP